MATQAIGTEQVTEQKPKAKRPRRTVSVGFRGPDGGSLRVSLRIAKDGKAWTTWVSHKPKSGQSTRGATEKHTSLDKAEGAMSRAIEKAVRLGWERRVRKGFEAKPDAFDLSSMPPAAVPPAKGKK